MKGWPVDEGAGVVDEDEGGVDVETDGRDGILSGQDARQLQAEPVVNFNVAVVLQENKALQSSSLNQQALPRTRTRLR